MFTYRQALKAGFKHEAWRQQRGSKQEWIIGETVKIGFLTLVFKGYKNDNNCQRMLESLDGTKQYIFEPHMGLHRIFN